VMDKFVNPFSDYGFKLIFGREISKDLIISFLNALLPNEEIINITFRNVEMLGMKHDQRKAVFDIFCENQKGEFFIVEMQKSRQKYFSDRVLYYASFAIQQQALVEKKKLEDARNITTKRWNYNVNKVYVVCILNYIMDSTHPEKYRWDIVRMDRELKVPFSETLNEIYLEMPKFTLPLSECDTLYKKWLYVLNNIEIMERLPQELNNQMFQKLKSIVEVERMTPDERMEYELSLSVERDLFSALEASYEDGEEKGIQKGIQKGLQKGKLEGILEGVEKVAKTMKAKGMSIMDIVDMTSLSPEVVNQL
ncbi:MAG: Rpn family recombination-promoting nuclease/putative transposase, partial [Tannerellaceae bacterium]